MGLIAAMVIFADFNNFDPEGFIRLNSKGTMHDLITNGIALSEGLRLLVSDGDLYAEIEVLRPSMESIWRGKIVSVIAEAK